MSKLRDSLLIYRKEIIFGSIIFVVSTLSFALGYVASQQKNHAPIVIEDCKETQ